MAFLLKFNSEPPDIRVVRDAIERAIHTSRFTAQVSIKWGRRNAIVIETVRLRVKKGYCGNHPGACVIQRKHKTMNYLEGLDWVEWNDMLNDVLDARYADVNAASSHVVIRKGQSRCVNYTSRFVGAFGHQDWNKDSGEFADWCGRKAPRSKYPYGTPGGAEEHDEEEEEPLGPYENWMVKSNLLHIQEEKLEPTAVVAQLRSNGYPRVAAAVEKEWGSGV